MIDRKRQHSELAELSCDEMAQVLGGDGSHGTHVAGTIAAIGNNTLSVADTEIAAGTLIPVKVKHNV